MSLSDTSRVEVPLLLKLQVLGNSFDQGQEKSNQQTTEF